MMPTLFIWSFMVSMTLDGYFYLSYSMYPLLNGIIIKPTVDALTAFEAVRAKYEEVLADYNQ
jgi:hypothetical protein